MPDRQVIVVEAHAPVREAICHYLGNGAGFTVVAQASHCEEADGLLRRHAARTIILGHILPQANSTEYLRRWTQRRNPPRVVALLGHVPHVYIRQLVAAGASAIIGWKSALEDLDAAMKAVAAGRTYFNGYAEILGRRSTPQGSDRLPTSREKMILREIASGYSNKEIAERLSLSVYTVENHRASLRRKLGLTSTAQLVLYAIQTGLVNWPG
jgi:two-component system, NarL family, nitrate/nitrite response regulator NarL